MTLIEQVYEALGIVEDKLLEDLSTRNMRMAVYANENPKLRRCWREFTRRHFTGLTKWDEYTLDDHRRIYKYLTKLTGM